MTNYNNYKVKIPAIFLWIMLLILLFMPNADGANGESQAILQESPETLIKVGLTRNVSSITTRIDAGSYTIVDGATGLPVAGLSQGDTLVFNKVGGSVQVIINGEPQSSTYRGPVILRASDKNALNLFSMQNVRYRDELRILNDELLAAVNVLDIEKYLYGVIGPEMGVSAAPMEALKAQAVVSRSYALNLYHPTNNWDVGIDTQTQVYGGYTAETSFGGERVVQAVNETKGLVIYYDFNENAINRPIQAFFHSNAGGHTESSENVWSTGVPYIIATPSPYDDYAMKYPNQTEGGWPTNTYSWTVNLSRSDIVARIHQWNEINNNGEKIIIGELEDIKTGRLQRLLPGETASRRVTEIEFIGNEGVGSIFWERTRTFFGLRSNLYDLSLDSDLAIMNSTGIITMVSKGLNLIGIGGSNNLSLVNGSLDNYHIIGAGNKTSSIPKVFNNATFNGKGNGHGLGMSQWGAMGMANAGYNYIDIIQHYYNQGRNDGSIVIKPYRSY